MLNSTSEWRLSELLFYLHNLHLHRCKYKKIRGSVLFKRTVTDLLLYIALANIIITDSLEVISKTLQ